VVWLAAVRFWESRFVTVNDRSHNQERVTISGYKGWRRADLFRQELKTQPIAGLGAGLADHTGCNLKNRMVAEAG